MVSMRYLIYNINTLFLLPEYWVCLLYSPLVSRWLYSSRQFLVQCWLRAWRSCKFNSGFHSRSLCTEISPEYLNLFTILCTVDDERLQFFAGLCWEIWCLGRKCWCQLCVWAFGAWIVESRYPHLLLINLTLLEWWRIFWSTTWLEWIRF